MLEGHVKAIGDLIRMIININYKKDGAIIYMIKEKLMNMVEK